VIGSCLVCGRRVPEPPRLCSNCTPVLLPGDLGRMGVSLYAYEGFPKEIVRETKISQSYAHQKIMEHLLVQAFSHPPVSDLIQGASLIVPAPSSLWSRLRGRFDCAWMMAGVAARHFEKPLVSVPFKGYLKWQKETHKERRSPGGFHKNQTSSRGGYLLFVDDVITTGTTFARVGEFFPGHKARYLTFGASGRWLE
jgi:predicted amidophosphoribosyltransferase